jgi:hypothetical protein
MDHSFLEVSDLATCSRNVMGGQFKVRCLLKFSTNYRLASSSSASAGDPQIKVSLIRLSPHNSPARRPWPKALIVSAGILAVTLLFLSNRSAHATSPVIISQCGNINQPGNYVLTSTVVLHLPDVSGNGDCLVISSSNVTIDLQGYKITADCPIIAPPSYLEFGPVGGTGVDVLNGATRVSISN